MAHEIDFRKLMKEEKIKLKQKATEQNAPETQQQDCNNITCTSIVHSNNSVQDKIPSWTQLGLPTLDRLKHCVSRNPAHIYYLPEVLSPTQQTDLYQWLFQLPHATTTNKTEASTACWNTLTYSQRRVAVFQSPDLPCPLALLSNAMVAAGIFTKEYAPNHVLINHYHHPCQGILPHTDGPLYHPRTATISIGGSNVIIHFTPRLSTSHIGLQQDNDNKPSLQVLLEGNGSLLLFSDDAYTNYLHSINDNVDVEAVNESCGNAPAGTKVIREGGRISLTFRHKLA